MTSGSLDALFLIATFGEAAFLAPGPRESPSGDTLPSPLPLSLSFVLSSGQGASGSHSITL